MSVTLQRTFFSHIKRDALASEICAEILDTESALIGKERATEANFDAIWDVWGSDGKHLGKAYNVNEDMVDYVHEAIEAGGIGPMEGRVDSAWEN